MEYEGSVTYFCTGCALQGMVLWDPRDLRELVCPRCGSKVMTPHPAREKASVQPVCS